MTKRWNERDLAYYNAQRRLMTELAKAPHKPVEFTIGREYTFIVAGLAEPGGSKQAFVPLHPTTKEPYRRSGGGIVVSVVDANKNVEHWKNHVAKVARNEYPGPIFTGFLRVTWIFYQPRPQDHYTSTGKLSKHGLETPWPNVRPDTTKLVRAAEDALRSICYSDDAIIVKQKAEKEYGSPARMEVTIEELLVPEPFEQPALFEVPAPWETGVTADARQKASDDRPGLVSAATDPKGMCDGGTAHSDQSGEPVEPAPWDVQDPARSEKKNGKNSRGR